MQKLLSVLRLDFLPRNVDFSLLLLRLWLGLTMLFNHGFGKLGGFREGAQTFEDPLGIGSTASLVLAVFAEVLCSALLTLGLLSRFAALNLAITMAVAFFIVHGSALSGDQSGELAFIYLAGYLVLVFAGGGKYSLDRRLFGRRPGYPQAAPRGPVITRERV
jgi:putative oxidoreductase